ncbi:phage tail assembly chaperone [Brevundimonas sp. NIBR11]|uniref:phage tail assembly chaperone n=1 Tax=Brevundimonas sp. NIBR11 TaxID=3015999 RepID=UPI0022F03239|nr:phage tail assembly chaperone [Brevundimonas sp. NIBR11]
MLRLGASLGLTPNAFWRLSLSEWRMLTEVTPAGVPLARGEFEHLMATWPDGEMR